MIALAYALSSLLLQPFSFSASSLISTADRSDFRITDFYYLVADNRNVCELDTSIVIINIDNSDREEITDILEVLQFANPRVVGIDVLFEQPQEDDLRLVEAISQCHGVVMPASVEADSTSKKSGMFKVSGVSCVDSLLVNVTHGVVNFPSLHTNGTVRDFKIEFPTDHNGNLPSFPVAVAKAADPKSFKRLKKRGKDLEAINYPSREFTVLDPSELLDSLDYLNDKIILLGAMTEESDRHHTPVGDAMSGVEIHAHAIATILNGGYLNMLSPTQNNLIAFSLCFIVAFLSLLINPGIKGLLLRILQLSLLYLLLRCGYAMFVDRGVVFDLSMSLLMVAFALFASDVWIGTRTTCRWLIAYHHKKHNT